MANPSSGRRGAERPDAGGKPSDERNGPAGTVPSDRAAVKRKDEADCTEVGQAAGAPGGRGGTTPYGGIERVTPRTGR